MRKVRQKQKLRLQKSNKGGWITKFCLTLLNAYLGKGGENYVPTKSRERLGEIDEYGVAEWYPKCKLRREGNVYIATPHTTNPTGHTKKPIPTINVTVTDGRYYLEDDKNTVQTVKHSKNDNSTTVEDSEVITTTFKDIFNELYNKYSRLLPHERKKAIFIDMLSLFQDEQIAKEFIDAQWRRKGRNNYVRRQRFEYKANNQDYEFFFTITYDDKKHSEQSFIKSLKNTFANFHKRYGCLFQGIWERGKEKERLHFHGLIYDPNRKILGNLEEASDYNPKTGRMRTYLHSPYFTDKFGRNEFDAIIPQMYSNAIDYITKYITKFGVKPYYSKGLYSFIETDISGDDVICRMSDDESRDIRLLVRPNCNLWKDGEFIGKPTKEAIAQVPKIP